VNECVSLLSLSLSLSLTDVKTEFIFIVFGERALLLNWREIQQFIIARVAREQRGAFVFRCRCIRKREKMTRKSKNGTENVMYRPIFL